MNNKSCVVDEILDNIDLIQESSDEVAYNVITAMDDLYTKYGMITEQFTKPADSDVFFFQEGAIGDEMAKMKKEGESGAWSAIAALPRFIAALSRVLLNKMNGIETDITKKYDADKFKKNTGLISSILKSKDKPKQNKLKDFLAKAGKVFAVSLVATGGIGTVMHFKHKTDSQLYPGLEIDENGKYKIGADLKAAIEDSTTVVEFLEKFDKVGSKSAYPDMKDNLKELYKMDQRAFTEVYRSKNGQDAEESYSGLWDIFDRGTNTIRNTAKSLDKIADKIKRKIQDKTINLSTSNNTFAQVLGATADTFGNVIESLLKGLRRLIDFIVNTLSFIGNIIMTIISIPFGIFDKVSHRNDDSDNNAEDDNNAAVAESYNEEGVINMNNEVYVESKNGIAVDTMRGEKMIRNVDGGEYHSGSSNSPAKKTAMKITGDKMCAPASKIRDAMVGKNLRTVDKNGKIKLYEVTVGKSLIDKDQDIVVELKDGTATFKVSNKKCVKESYEFRSSLLNTFFGEAFVPETKEAAKKIVKKTPWGDVTIQESYEDESEDEVIEEATFITYVDYDEMVQESADESSKEDGKKEDKKAETVEECGDAASKTVEECGDGSCNPADKKVVSEEKEDESAEGSNETVQEEFTPNPWYSL